MADIFISYKKEDAGRVVRIVEGLRAEGLSVWWDHGIQAGSQWDQTIKTELAAAKMVVAIWSERSVDAPWVKEEAGVGKMRGVLLPVKIDEVDPPLGFTLIQAADLVDWSGDGKDQRWKFFLEAVKSILSGEARAGFDAPLKKRSKRRGAPIWVWALGVFGILALGMTVIAASAYRDYRIRAEVARQDGTTYAIEAGTAAAPAVQAAPSGSPAGAEQELWNRALASKKRGDLQSYLAAFPSGVYADRARNNLLLCRDEISEAWEETPIKSNQAVRGVGSVPNDGKTEAQACAAAKKMANAQAKTNCEAIAGNTGYRNPVWSVRDQDCSCNKTSDIVTVCVADLSASCSWESKIQRQVEVCG